MRIWNFGNHLCDLGFSAVRNILPQRRKGRGEILVESGRREVEERRKCEREGERSLWKGAGGRWKNVVKVNLNMNEVRFWGFMV